MTNTPEAVRLADWLEADACDLEAPRQAAALLRRIPDLEAEVQEQARLNGMGAERELALMAQVSRLEAERDQLRAELENVRVPDGWKLVPIKCTEAMKDVGGQFEFATISDGRLLAQSMWNELLCATPTPPAQAAADARDAERYRWLRDQANTSVNIDIGAGCEISDTLDAAIDAILAKLQAAQAEPVQSKCLTCNGHGLIGGHMQDGSGYGEGCPDCNPEPSHADPIEIERKQRQAAVARFVDENRSRQTEPVQT